MDGSRIHVTVRAMVSQRRTCPRREGFGRALGGLFAAVVLVASVRAQVRPAPTRDELASYQALRQRALRAVRRVPKLVPDQPQFAKRLSAQMGKALELSEPRALHAVYPAPGRLAEAEALEGLSRGWVGAMADYLLVDKRPEVADLPLPPGDSVERFITQAVEGAEFEGAQEHRVQVLHFLDRFGILDAGWRIDLRRLYLEWNARYGGEDTAGAWRGVFKGLGEIVQDTPGRLPATLGDASFELERRASRGEAPSEKHLSGGFAAARIQAEAEAEEPTPEPSPTPPASPTPVEPAGGGAEATQVARSFPTRTTTRRKEKKPPPAGFFVLVGLFGIGGGCVVAFMIFRHMGKRDDADLEPTGDPSWRPAREPDAVLPLRVGEQIHTFELWRKSSGEVLVFVDKQAVNGKLEKPPGQMSQDSSTRFQLGERSLLAHVLDGRAGFTYDLSLDGRSLSTGEAVRETTTSLGPALIGKVVFSVIFVGFPLGLLVLQGGAVGAGIGFTGMSVCFGIEKQDWRPLWVRYLACILVVLFAWFVYIQIAGFAVGFIHGWNAAQGR